MNRSTKLVILVVCLCLGGVSTVAQTQRNPMTNADVVELVRAGYPENIVILAVRRSEPNFDTSAQALIELKNSGVNAKIIEAILLLGPADAEPGTANLAAVAPNEVVLVDEEKRIPMIRAEISGGRVSYSFFGIGTSKSLWSFPGNRARLRLLNGSPEFEAAVLADLEPSENLMIVRLKVRSNRREVQVGRLGSSKQTRDGMQKDMIVESTFEAIGSYTVSCGDRYKVYRVKLRHPLPPGEYGFAARKRGFPVYDFGVDGLTP